MSPADLTTIRRDALKLARAINDAKDASEDLLAMVARLAEAVEEKNGEIRNLEAKVAEFEEEAAEAAP